MTNGEQKLSEEQWQAILNNDVSCDGEFFYAVKTTGIFCRPSCKSRLPKQEHVRIFENAQEALSAQYRPCKRCKPTGERLPDKEWVSVITEYIEHNFTEPLTLEILAETCHGSPYHLHRTFKNIMEKTPLDYIQQKRIEKASEYLVHTNMAVTDIARKVGIPNTPYFTTLFKKRTGCTPTQYRQQHQQEASNAIQ
ncbi:bifunctional transcriptional activator/DNA repair enzyme AdaA [Paenibacillus monticola]|uniref:AraC family transcriptional regulator n=1 Tax=Paenibacillus monticola TaxID=2666075 RepID=A0A7X2H7V1_9BACL|nr:bifunctional transcriptional activator/DNA repair enzyme AdaA [Paenibacillus monticola]MRN55063.1 AraC family transcriptional regulator [Paenibacillus monticola]